MNPEDLRSETETPAPGFTPRIPAKFRRVRARRGAAGKSFGRPAGKSFGDRKGRKPRSPSGTRSPSASRTANGVRSPAAAKAEQLVRHVASLVQSPALGIRSRSRHVLADRAAARAAALATVSPSARKSLSVARVPRHAAISAASPTSVSHGRKRRRRVLPALPSMLQLRAEPRAATPHRAIRDSMTESPVLRRAASTSLVRPAANRALERRRALGIARHGKSLGTGLHRSRVGISRLLRRVPRSCGTRTMTTYRVSD